jgi:hypothetical protein
MGPRAEVNSVDVIQAPKPEPRIMRYELNDLPLYSITSSASALVREDENEFW